MELLIKISIIISFVGIILLLFLTNNIDFTLKGINNLTEEGKDITINGKVIDQKTYGNTSILIISTDCTLKAFSYDKKLQNLMDKNVTIKGTVKENFIPEIYIEKLINN